MNDRIKELIKSLGIIPEDEHYDVAEAVIKECVKLMEQEKEYYSNPSPYESRLYYDLCGAKVEAFDNAVDKISYHFGVK